MRLLKASILIVLCGMLCCCSGYIPMPDKLHEIELEQYNLDTNCCAHKSAKYATLLINNGFDAMVVVGKTIYGTNTLHAWVEVVNPETGKRYWIDPTWPKNTDGKLTERYYDRVKWIELDTGVTGDDVCRYWGIVKTYKDNIPKDRQLYIELRKKEYAKSMVTL